MEQMLVFLEQMLMFLEQMLVLLEVYLQMLVEQMLVLLEVYLVNSCHCSGDSNEFGDVIVWPTFQGGYTFRNILITSRAGRSEGVLRIALVLYSIALVVFFVKAITHLGSSTAEALGMIVGVIIAAPLVFLWLLFCRLSAYASSELIRVLMDIEANTRR